VMIGEQLVHHSVGHLREVIGKRCHQSGESEQMIKKKSG
jgi:hypothetical protein